MSKHMNCQPSLHGTVKYCCPIIKEMADEINIRAAHVYKTNDNPKFDLIYSLSHEILEKAKKIEELMAKKGVGGVE